MTSYARGIHSPELTRMKTETKRICDASLSTNVTQWVSNMNLSFVLVIFSTVPNIESFSTSMYNLFTYLAQFAFLVLVTASLIS